MPPITLDEGALRILVSYKWPGNVRQLKNVTEQISVIEERRMITADILQAYLPDYNTIKLPALYQGSAAETSFSNEREILYKILFDMRNDVNDLKKLVFDLMTSSKQSFDIQSESAGIIQNLYKEGNSFINTSGSTISDSKPFTQVQHDIEDTEEVVEESLSLAEKEIEMIRKALEKFKGKRKNAAQELGISERTLYRKIKEYNLE
jgi:transcriptional regulator with PAS, ATPase and Fis domain